MNPDENTPYDNTTSELEEQSLWQKYKVSFIIILVLLALASILIPLMRTVNEGKLVVTTDDANATMSALWSLTDNGAGNDEDPQNAKQSAKPSTPLKSGKSAVLKPGVYIVSIEGSQGSVSQTVKVTAKHTARYTINIPRAGSVEPVANVNAPDFVAGPAAITYRDQSSNHLYQLNTNDRLSLTDDSVDLVLARWADATTGVGKDASDNLYGIKNGKVTPLHNPVSAGSFTIAPNGTIYFDHKGDLYSGRIGGAFTKIFTTKNPPVYITATNQNIALDYYPGSGGGNEEGASMTIVSADGKKVAESDFESYTMAWSTSGKYLATTNDSGSQIYDASLHRVNALPSNNVIGLAWSDDNTVFYALGEQVWKYTLDNGKAVEVGTLAKDHAIVGITMDTEKNYMYLSGQDSAGGNDDLSIYRVGLHGQTDSIPAHLSIATQHLPAVDGRCMFSLTNFKQPTIQLYADVPEDNCPLVARQYLQKLSVSPTLFNYVETDVPPNTPTS